MAAKPPDAFLSYTRFDDQHDGGAISEFCKRLASAVQAVTGTPFDIFQDVGGIGIGEHWPGKLDQMLDQARFFIPIVTPSYFTSTPCREELEKFLRAEAEHGRKDLVLPIYYIECDVLEEDEFRAADSLACTIHERQRQDWRELRFEPFEAKDVRRALEHLAREIVKARRRVVPGRPEAESQRTEERERTGADLSVERLHAQAERNRALLGAALRKEMTNLLPPRATARKRTEQPQVVGTVFRDIDAPWCPKMVVIPAGKFMMGSPDHDPKAHDREKPLHRVSIDYRLAVGCYPLTFEEYDHFCETSGHKEPKDWGWGRRRRPVTDVSWTDAKSYVAWLANETGQPYRLLSEAEWEYACRAGTTTRYWWGNKATPQNANYASEIGMTNEVDRYPANPWGLSDMHGNVWEWVEDCLHPDYQGAPDDGSAWTTGHCRDRMARGGAWNTGSSEVRSAQRQDYSTSISGRMIGFRVGRALDGPVGHRSSRPVVDSSQKAQPQSFEEAVELFRLRGEPMLHGWLYQAAHLVHFEPGRIELKLRAGTPAGLTGRIAAALGRWTGRPWLVALADDSERADPTLAEQADDRSRPANP